MRKLWDPGVLLISISLLVESERSSRFHHWNTTNHIYTPSALELMSLTLILTLVFVLGWTHLFNLCPVSLAHWAAQEKKKVTSTDPLRNSDVSGRVWLRYNADDLLQSRPYTPYNPSQLFRHPYRFRLPTASDDTTHCSTYFQWPWRQLTWITWITVGAIKYWYLFLVEAFWEEKQVLFHYTLSWRHGTQLSQSLYILKRLRDWILRTKRLPQLDQPLLNLCTPDLAFLLLHSC